MRILHQPADHPFVRAVAGAEHSGGFSSTWAVDRLLADGVSLVHVHFGFEQIDADTMTQWASDLAHAGIGLVHTVHDLDNPHLTDQTGFHRTVGVLVGAAGAVTTLTGAAARTLRERYGVDATVVPHPHVVPLCDAAMWRARRAARHGLYVHVATARPNLSLAAIERLVARPGRRPVRVHVRPQAPAAARERLDRLAARGRIVLDVRARLSDAELWDRLATAQLVVLPYRWGTHSGLLEAAHDLGTPVLAPGFGGYADQGASTFVDDPAPAVASALARRPTVTVAGRRRQAMSVRRAYQDVYRAVTRAAA